MSDPLCICGLAARLGDTKPPHCPAHPARIWPSALWLLAMVACGVALWLECGHV